MILKETILSAFTERGTLLKWLKKVETALNGAVLTDIEVEQISNSQFKLKFIFESGDTVETPVITYPEGGRIDAINVNQDETSFQFIFTLKDGTELYTPFITFPDALARVRYVHQGDIQSISASNNGIHINGRMTLADGNNIVVTVYDNEVDIPLVGSDTVVIDVTEDGKKFEIHLDAEVTAKLSRTLLTPVSAPASTSIVAVDTANAQGFLTLGNGLHISNGALSVITYDGSVS